MKRPLALLALVLLLLTAVQPMLLAQDGLLSLFTPGKNKISNNMKQLGLAIHNYHDTFRAIPPTGLDYPQSGEQKPKEQLSWRVRLLPYLEQYDLYEQFNFNEPWDGPTNKPLLAKMPDVFKSPGAKVDDPGKTCFLAVTMDADAARFLQQAKEAEGENATRGPRWSTAFDMIFEGRRQPGYATRTRIAHMLDGTSNSVMVVEVDSERAVPWTKPDDLAFQWSEPWKGMGTLRRGVVNVLMGDGSVGSLPKEKVNDDLLRQLFFIDDRGPRDAKRAFIESIRF